MTDKIEITIEVTDRVKFSSERWVPTMDINGRYTPGHWAPSSPPVMDLPRGGPFIIAIERGERLTILAELP